jgi:hypothetical protein
MEAVKGDKIARELPSDAFNLKPAADIFQKSLGDSVSK